MYCFVRTYAAVPVQLEIVFFQYIGWCVLIMRAFSSINSAALPVIIIIIIVPFPRRICFSEDSNTKLFRNAGFVALPAVLMLIQVFRVIALRGPVACYKLVGAVYDLFLNSTSRLSAASSKI
jgi:hypothetical protein